MFSPCDFSVVQLNVAAANSQHSTAVLQLWGENEQDLTKVHTAMNALVEGFNPVAECTITDVPVPEAVGAAETALHVHARLADHTVKTAQ
jgi:hypothetical protein